MLEDARAGRTVKRTINLVEPQDHTKDYDRAIKMMEMNTEPIVELEEHEFNCYVMDEWGWAAQASMINRSYSTSTPVYN